jgi:hypothetical protein
MPSANKQNNAHWSMKLRTRVVRHTLLAALGIAAVAAGVGALSVTREAKADYTWRADPCVVSFVQSHSPGTLGISRPRIVFGCVEGDSYWTADTYTYSWQEGVSFSPLPFHLKVIEAAYLSGKLLDIHYEPSYTYGNSKYFDLLSMHD